MSEDAGVRMPQVAHHHHRGDLVRIATEAMIDRGLESEFPVAVRTELAALAAEPHFDW
jgi:hypothetical protein